MTTRTDSTDLLYRYYTPRGLDGFGGDGCNARFSNRAAAEELSLLRYPNRTPHILTGLTRHRASIHASVDAYLGLS